uniref:Uncharacterized protein n=1 Tax=Setaria viridis TaxID=4556 RepID=A0A4U6UVS9_SETVI|nr:hypothetical protein SEVIR_4G107801v2 [Setaria viridis]
MEPWRGFQAMVLYARARERRRPKRPPGRGIPATCAAEVVTSRRSGSGTCRQGMDIARAPGSQHATAAVRCGERMHMHVG